MTEAVKVRGRRKPTPQVEQAPDAGQDTIQADSEQAQDSTPGPSTYSLTYIGNCDLFKWNDELVFKKGRPQDVPEDIFKKIQAGKYAYDFTE